MTNWGGWTGWTGVPAPNAPENRPPPAGADLEPEPEPDDLIGPEAKKYVLPMKRPRSNRSKEYIDRDLIERVLLDDQGQELQWLMELLQDGVRVLNNTGRYVKSEPFMARIRKQKKLIQ